MNNSQLMTAVKYTYKRTLTTLLIMSLVIVALMSYVVITGYLASRNGFNGGHGSIGSLDFIMMIGVFVLGIVTVRDDYRIYVQNGLSRRTTFRAHIVTGILVPLTFTAAAYLLYLAGNALGAVAGNFSVTMLYELIYPQYLAAHPIAGTLLGLLMVVCWGAAAHYLGMFCSLLFYRLPKGWKIAVAITIPCLLVFGLPIISVAFLMHLPVTYELLYKLFVWLAAAPLNLTLAAVITALVVELINWFGLVRRVYIK